jgi:uncharacterized membrane protein
MESLFELLFKYRPLVYERGELAFTLPATWLVGLGSALAGIAVLSYLRARGRSGRGDRAVLAGVRLALLAVVLLMLARPVLLISTVVPQENYLGVLLDDSRSMRIDDGASRAALVHDAFLAPESGLRNALARRFRLRTYRFSESTARLGDGESLEFAGTRTRLGAALESVRDELSSLPLTGLVVVTDGADQDPDALEDELLPLRAGGIPVFTVGVGSERFERDIELVRVEAPTTTLAGSAALAEVVVEHTGYEGRTVPLVVERDGRIVGRREVELGAEGSAVVQIDFETGESGPGTYRFRVPVQEGELVDRNNEREVGLTLRTGPQRILYFEGEPRHEVAFTRRAVADDAAIQLVVLQRTDAERYLRLGVDSASELAGGFPRTREELFTYRGIVLGSVEASHFTHDQLAMIEEFVTERGGGLLMLGGRNALAEGGWAGTPVAAALPVVLDPALAADSLFHVEAAVSPSRAAATDPVTRMQEGAPVIPWRELPGLTVYNRFGPAKPGATTLLAAEAASLAGQPVLAHQRYGAGRAAVFAVQDAWLWQMHADIPPEDETHERLWRQLLRWLVSGTPDRVMAALPAEGGAPGEALELSARVRDARFEPVNGATAVARITAPSGEVREVPLSWTATRDGEYAARFTPDEPGLHSVQVTARHEGGTTESVPAVLRAGPSLDEYFGAGMRRAALERLAEETGGRFYTADAVGDLAEDLAYSTRGVTVVEERELWDLPAAFLVILVLISVEWMYRRRRGMA